MLRILFTLGLAIVTCGCNHSPGGGTLDPDDVAGTPGFVMADNLMGTVLRSSDQAQRLAWERGTATAGGHGL